jgi:xanthine dehydrogenase iron-sulfur cluster and FAD-binding subunit A
MQCGYCTSGMVISATALLERSPHPTEAEVRQSLSTNLCRCGVYGRAIRAVLGRPTDGRQAGPPRGTHRGRRRRISRPRSGKVEFGQGICTGFAQIVADGSTFCSNG